MTHFNPFFFWAPAVLLVPVLLLAGYIYFSLQVELRLLARRVVTRGELDARWTEVVTELELLRAQVTVAAEARPTVPDWAPPDRPAAALNLNRRGQILRLHGKGRSTVEIASDLQISQGEVELLLKVHDWSASTSL
jgi:DNA-binding NarL/FixJ family response regulator